METTEAAEMLKFAMENGIINIDQIQAEINMKKTKEILKKHPYTIWVGKDGYWRTYLPNPDGTRRLIKKKSEEDVTESVIDYWKDKQDCAFKERFDIWVDRQEKCGRSGNTIYKYGKDYKRFIAGDEFENMDIRNISEIEISEFLRRTLEKKDVPYKALKALFGYINGVFQKSMIDKIITINPCQYVDLPCFKQYCVETPKKSAEERTFSQKERSATLDKVNTRETVTRYAVGLALFTGMRVGEIAALKWENINYAENELLVCLSEKTNRLTKEIFISFTKNDRNRIIPLTDDMKDILDRVKRLEIKNGWLSEFVFSNKNGRIKACTISDCARNLTMTSEFLNPKSVHAARRTLNSNMRCNGVSATVTSAILGNTERVNDMYYTYDVSTKEYKYDVINNAGKIV